MELYVVVAISAGLAVATVGAAALGLFSLGVRACAREGGPPAVALARALSPPPGRERRGWLRVYVAALVLGYVAHLAGQLWVDEIERSVPIDAVDISIGLRFLVRGFLYDRDLFAAHDQLVALCTAAALGALATIAWRSFVAALGGAVSAAGDLAVFALCVGAAPLALAFGIGAVDPEGFVEALRRIVETVEVRPAQSVAWFATVSAGVILPRAATLAVLAAMPLRRHAQAVRRVGAVATAMTGCGVALAIFWVKRFGLPA